MLFRSVSQSRYRLDRAGVTWEMFCQWLSDSKIEKLSVSDSEMLGQLPYMPSVTHLDLSKISNMYKLHSYVSSLHNLSSLFAFTMNNTFMVNFDPLMKLLPSHLTYLSLSANFMSKIPAGLDQLVSLRLL